MSLLAELTNPEVLRERISCTADLWPYRVLWSVERAESLAKPQEMSKPTELHWWKCCFLVLASRMVKDEIWWGEADMESSSYNTRAVIERTMERCATFANKAHICEVSFSQDLHTSSHLPAPSITTWMQASYFTYWIQLRLRPKSLC